MQCPNYLTALKQALMTPSTTQRQLVDGKNRSCDNYYRMHASYFPLLQLSAGNAQSATRKCTLSPFQQLTNTAIWQ